MEYRFVGGSDLKVFALSLDTATSGGGNEFFKAWDDTDVPEASRLVEIALAAGVTLFDSADAYSGGLAEAILGKAIAGRRTSLLISSPRARPAFIAWGRTLSISGNCTRSTPWRRSTKG